MTKLPPISARMLLKVLLKNGYYVRNQKGSHIHLRHPVRKPITIPNHKVIAKGTLLEILKQTGLRKEDLK
jgi:predicted RNA binding protein YcfA (HicA-like mRNA interferase family)